MEIAGSFEAKTHFSRRLDRVARGEEIAITKSHPRTASNFASGLAA
jgi:antitoxin (DNA-binding transcriptional repressor) of toxin-antitoxin stability system